MTINNVRANTVIDPTFSSAEKSAIENALEAIYNGSSLARSMIDNWLSISGHQLIFVFTKDTLRGPFNTGTVQLDINFLNTINYLDDNGKAVELDLVHLITHELGHSLTGTPDNPTYIFDYKGDNLRLTNPMLQELGISERNSYSGSANDSILTPGQEYTNGGAIDRSFSGDRDWNSSSALISDDLLIGGPSANTLESGLGDDFLFGGGGNDYLNGGIFGTDTVVFSGKPTDYDIRLNADGTWTSRHERGASDEGTDTLKNLERVQFAGGSTFNLSKGGLGYQNDFAFVIDQTGSMSDDIAAVQSAATSVVNALFADDTIDARVGIVGFRDNTNGEPTSVILPFTDQASFTDRKTAAISGINSISVSGGGDFPETAFDGLLTALNGSMGEWRIGAGTKKVALFTDASAKDSFLLPTVLSYALNIGATISASSTTALGSFGSVDTYELSFGSHESESFDPSSEGDVFPGFVPSGDAIEPPGGTATVQVITIFIETFTSPDLSFTELSDSTGGTVLTAANAAEVVERLLEVVTAANYLLAVDRPVVSEGNTGTIDVTFTLSRDRVTNASTVILAPAGTADGFDVLGAPTSVNFAIGEISKTITVSVVGDKVNEGDETFGLRIIDINELSNFGSSTVNFIIQDDDAINTITGSDASEAISGTPFDDEINAVGGDDAVSPLAGYDRIILGAGSDKVFGSPSELYGDTVTDFSAEDQIVFQNFSLARSAFIVSTGSSILGIDDDNDGSEDGSVTLEGDFSGGDFMAVANGSDTVLTFETFLPFLKERQAVDPALVNGIINQDFLKGDGSTDFIVTLRDLGFAGYNNVVGVYEIDSSGLIVDTRIIFANANADKAAQATITGVESGNRLGFFIVQDAADWAATLAGGDTFSFVNDAAAPATLADGAAIHLAVDGAMIDEMVFHSFTDAMNSDGVRHVLSGVDIGGESILIGFEDLTGGGDRDYEDVAFRVELV